MTAAAEERHLLAALLFSALLCFKHIFLYAAPAFFVYMLRRYCRFACGPFLPCTWRAACMAQLLAWHSCLRGTAACKLCVGMRATEHACDASLLGAGQCSPHSALPHLKQAPEVLVPPLSSRGPQAVLRFAALGAIAAGVLGLSFGPFVAAGQLPQVRKWALLHLQAVSRHRRLSSKRCLLLRAVPPA